MLRSLLITCLLATPLMAQEVQILPGYSDFRVPPSQVTDQPMLLVQDLVFGFPGEGGEPSMELLSGFEGDRLFIQYTEDGVADDSTRTLQRRYEFVQTDDWQWRLVGYGHRQRCWRGGVEGWTDKPCP